MRLLEQVVKRFVLFMLFVAVLLGPARSDAYPTSIVFVPTGEARNFLDVGVYGYFGFILKQPDATASTDFVPWTGINIGLIPRFKYGASGTGFGGLELGLDTLRSMVPQPHTKVVLNAKMQLFTESGLLPHLALGAIQYAPFEQEQSAMMGFATATKTLQFGSLNFGRITLGYLRAFTHKPELFYGTAPFGRSSQSGLMGGYESPAFGPFSVAVEQLGGYSEASNTNAAIWWHPLDGGSIGVGGFLATDRRTSAAYDGLFTMVALDFNLLKKPQPAAAVEGK